MKPIHRLLFLTAVVTASLSAFGGATGTVSFIVLSKEHDFIQTGPSTVADDPSHPFRLGVDVSGTNESAGFPSSPNQIASTPAGSGISGPLALVAPDSFNNQWQFKSSSFSDAASLNAAFAAGTYSLQIGGQSFGLNIPVGNSGNNFLFPDTPTVTATNATWLPDGTLFYDERNGPLTLTSNTFATNAGTTVHLGINVDPSNGQPGGFADFSPQAFGSGSSSISQTFLNPSEFVDGTTYQVQLEFDNIVDGPYALGGALTGGQDVATYTTRTTFNMEVIPEPSTYAAIAGILSLSLAVWRRRAVAKTWSSPHA